MLLAGHGRGTSPDAREGPRQAHYALAGEPDARPPDGGGATHGARERRPATARPRGRAARLPPLCRRQAPPGNGPGARAGARRPAPFLLPGRRMAHVSPDPPPAPLLAPAARSRPVVLAIDDTPSILDLVRSCLEAEGYRVVTCLQARDALRLARAEQPDAIMLDLVMPEMSGWEVLAALRAGGSPFVQTPVIVCTAYMAEALGRLDELRGPSGHGHVGVLPKPFDVEELLDVVESVTGGPPRAATGSVLDGRGT